RPPPPKEPPMNRPVLRLAPLIAAGLLAVCGCSPGKGTVSGKVTYKGKPVVWGTVSAVASDNVQYAAPITPQGTYSIPKRPGRPVRLTVSSPNPGVKPGSPLARGGAGDGAEDRKSTRLNSSH